MSVSQYRLAFHLTLACVIFAMIVWTWLRFGRMRRAHVVRALRGERNRAGRSGACQIYLGALVAGLDAGLLYNTWPLIDGALFRRWSVCFLEPRWRNLFENALTVQFVHRTWLMSSVVAALHAVDARRASRAGRRIGALALRRGITAQAASAVATLLHQAPIALALAHQAMAIAVLTIAVVHAER